jgi:hypothetical protein
MVEQGSAGKAPQWLAAADSPAFAACQYHRRCAQSLFHPPEAPSFKG